MALVLLLLVSARPRFIVDLAIRHRAAGVASADQIDDATRGATKRFAGDAPAAPSAADLLGAAAATPDSRLARVGFASIGSRCVGRVHRQSR